MFVICARLFEHQDFIRGFLKGGTFSCNKLKDALQHDFDSSIAMTEIQVLGLLGKLLTGPWMSKFYKGADSGVTYTEGIGIIKYVLAKVEDTLHDPGLTLSTTHDFFGGELPKTRDVEVLQVEAVDKNLFLEMMEAC